MSTIDDVRRICLSLPHVVEKPNFGMAAWRVKDKLFAKMRDDLGGVVVMRPDAAEKEALIASDPEKFSNPPEDKKRAWQWIVVRLEAVESSELEELLTDSWLLRAPPKVAASFAGRER